jgi:creatinine amidohydrolase/Fe(II)-dependent formamide hydrolase-like protein
MLPEANPYKYEYMRLAQIREVLASCPLAIQPTGLLEWHGEQNPIGMDGLSATYICERVIARLGNGVLMPTNWIGTYGYATYPGGVVFEQDTTEAVFLQIYRELLKIGFRVIVILTGHWGQSQQDALSKARETATQEAKDAGLDVRLLGYRWNDFLVEQMSYGGHAQEGETSMAWKIGEEIGLNLVDLEGYQPGTEHIVQYPVGNRQLPKEESETWDWKEEVADASKCSPLVGEAFFDEIVDNMVEELTDALEEIGFKLP